MKKYLILVALLVLASSLPVLAEHEPEKSDWSDFKTQPDFDEDAEHPKTEKKPDDKPFILKFGVESMSRTRTIAGGSYLYAEFIGRLTDGFSLSMKYSSSQVPYTDDDNCLFGGAIFRLGSYDGGYDAFFSPLYMTNITGRRRLDKNIGAKLCLLSQSDSKAKIHIEFLPFTILYNTTGRKFSYAFEFISLGFMF